MELSSKLVSTVFPEFHPVATFIVYTLHPTTFYQSGVYLVSYGFWYIGGGNWKDL